MFCNAIFSTFLLLHFFYLSAVQGDVVTSMASPGEACQFPDGVSGICQPLATCTETSGGVMKRRNHIVKCATDSQTLHVCCRRPKEIAQKICRVWSQYWREKSLNSDEVCVEEFPLIHGGKEAILGEFPNMVSLGRRIQVGIRWFCGGSLITPLFVLTAAHCIISETSEMVMGLGEHDLESNQLTVIPTLQMGMPEGLAGIENITRNYRENSTIEQFIGVEEVFEYPDYDKLYHDIALVKLKEPAQLTERVLPACLSTSTQSQFSHRQFIVSGWGDQHFDRDKATKLQKVAVKFIHPTTCLHTFRRRNPLVSPPLGITSDMFCAGDRGRDSCQGDSGGPLMDEPKKPCEPRTQTGIVAFGPPCREMGVYTKVSNYIDWITGLIAPGLVHNL